MEPSDYSAGDKLLHYLALGSPVIGRASFELDGIAARGRRGNTEDRHVFVAGLARAGTTILMRALYETGEFRSLTYRDMPFVLMPGIWNALAMPFRRTEKAKPRAHGDGILVDFDSPEAFEEVFWRVFSGQRYIFDDCLRPYEVSDAAVTLFREYVSRVIDSRHGAGGGRYLSKNNNNILRLAALRKAFPPAIIVIPFRDPMQQAISLLSQHRKFSERHARDRFSRDYMRWLGHHEFGATHKVFKFSDGPTVDAGPNATIDVRYWLRVWIDTYRYLLDHSPAGSRFLCYEDLCAKPEEILGGLLEAAGLRLDKPRVREKFNPPAWNGTMDAEGDLMDLARQTHAALRARAGKPAA